MADKVGTVKICGIPYTVRECENLLDADGVSFGQVEYLTGQILINSRATNDIKNETLCHEIVHAMLMSLGRNDMANDEMLVQQLGNAIYQTFTVKWEGE